MYTLGRSFGKVVQVAYLVEDIDSAMEEWLRLAGLGPWTCFRHIELETVFDGQSMALQIHEALAYMGDLQIQLVQSLNPADQMTPYYDFVRTKRWGLHHIAFFSRDIDADVSKAKEQGFGRICEMKDSFGHRYYYCQSTTMPDVWVELLERYPVLEDLLAKGIAEAASWDGSEPIRNVNMRTFRHRQNGG